MNDTLYCGKCGYELTGLANQDSCPECGHRFNMNSGAGLSSSPNISRKSSLFLRHMRTIFLVCSAVCIIICTGLLSMVVPNKEKLIYSSLFITGVVVLGAITSYIYEKYPD
jgi:uncharacterized membrane protein YvbJ